MKIFNKNVATGGIGVGSFAALLIAVFTWLFDPTEASEFCAANPKLIIISVVVLLFCIGLFVTLWLREKNESENKDVEIESKVKEIERKDEEIERKDVEIKRKDEEIERNGKSLYEGIKPRKTHTVLIVDDKESTRNQIKDELQGFDVVTMGKIEDYRLAAEFEIIVSDIFGCSPGTTAKSVLDMIKEKYPYKFVIPMSAQPAACEGLDADCPIIFKGEDLKNYMFVNQVVAKVKDFAKQLDNVSKHWQNVDAQLHRIDITEEKIEEFKSSYYSFLRNQSN